MENNLTADLIDVLLGAGSVLLSLLCVALLAGVRWVNTRVKVELVGRALEALRIAVTTAVKDVWAEYVKTIKESRADGALTADERIAAKSLAIAKARSYLGAKGIAMLAQAFGVKGDWLDTMIGGHVEAALHDVKLDARSSKALEVAELVPSPLPSSAAG